MIQQFELDKLQLNCNTHVEVLVSRQHAGELGSRDRVTVPVLHALVEQAQAGLAPLVDHEGDLVADA